MKVVTGQTTITTLKNIILEIFLNIQSVSWIIFLILPFLFGIIFTNYFKQIILSVNYNCFVKNLNFYRQW